MNESSLLASIAARSRDLRARFPHVVEGPGDDCGVLRPATQNQLLTVDQLVESRHFRPGTPVDLIARKAIARSMSDIAAMAGSPVAALATGTLPAGYPQDRADLLCQRLMHWCEHWGCPLVGGDIAAAAGACDPLVLTVTIVGRVHPSRGAVLRRTARVGDGIFVTGALGGSFDATTGLGRHLTFEPRVREAAWLADQLGDRLHAMMDISDGLGRDAGRMARASGVGLRIDAGSIPCGSGVDWQAALGDGEDYELIFAAEGSVPDFIPADARGPGVAITRIGRVVAESGMVCSVVAPDGREFDASEVGWDH